MPTKKEPKLTAIEEKKIENAVEKAKAEIIEKRDVTSEIEEYYKTEGRKRYECIVTSTRKGEKQFELNTPDPSNPTRPIKLHGRCGVRLKEGLPMYAITALQESYDLHCEEKEANMDPNVYADTIHTASNMPRYSVRIFKEVEDPKPLGKARPKKAEPIAVE